MQNTELNDKAIKMLHYADEIYKEYARMIDPTVMLPLGPKIKERLEQTPMFQGYNDFSFWGWAELLKSDSESAHGYLDGLNLKINNLAQNKIKQVKDIFSLIDECKIKEIEAAAETLDDDLKRIISS